MSVRQYKKGYEHGKTQFPFLKHRNGKRYDSKSGQQSYEHGYHKAVEERRSKERCSK